MKKQKPIIVVDIDDVLSASAEGFADYSNATWGSGIAAEDYHEDWAIPWGVSREEAARRALEYHNVAVHGRYKHFPEALSALKDLASHYDLVVVTSRRNSVKLATDTWLAKHFPGLFTEVIYAGMWDDHTDKNVDVKLGATKTDICLALGAKFLIDDQIKHCQSAAEADVKAILFGDYSWNRTNDPLHDNVVRLNNWQAVKEYFDAQRS